MERIGERDARLVGNALIALGDSSGAIERYQRALEIDPHSFVAYQNWGNALVRLGDVDGATDKFQRAMEINPALAPSEAGLDLLRSSPLDP